MANQWIVGLGLLLDALGALGIVVPDLPLFWRRWIVRRTPIYRKYWRAAFMFMGGEPYRRGLEKMDGNEIMEHLQALWPAVRDNSGFLRDVQFDDIQFEEASSPRISIEYTHHERGRDSRRLNVNDLKDWTNDYIDKWFRIYGWLLLMVGFLVQLIGTFL